MKSFSDFSSSARGNILLLGPPGVGKTTLCTQLPSPYLLEMDANLKGPVEVIKRLGLKLDFKYDIPHINDDGTLVPREKRLQRYAVLAEAAANDPLIKTVINDSLTTWQYYLEDEVRRQQGLKISNGTTQLVDEPLRVQDWRPFSGLAKELIIRQKASGKLNVWLGHIDARTDENKESVKGAESAYQPLLKYINFPGNLRQNMGALFDDVWLMSSELKLINGKFVSVRTLQTGATDFRDETLGLKSSIGLGHKFDLNFEELNKKLSA